MYDIFKSIDTVLIFVAGIIEKLKNIFSFRSERRSKFFLYILFIALVLTLAIPIRLIILFAFIKKFMNGKN